MNLEKININILIYFIIFSWVYIPFMKKKIVRKIKPECYFIINSIFSSIFVFMFYIYLNKIGKKIELNTIHKNDLFYCFINSLFGMTASFIVLILIKKNNINKILPRLQPVVLAVTSLIGYLFMNENLKKNEIFGIILIITGSYILQKNK
jgi:uncharacterized membrane protein